MVEHCRTKRRSGFESWRYDALEKASGLAVSFAALGFAERPYTGGCVLCIGVESER